MTRLAILSDIHGNLPALEAVMADMQPFAVDHVIVVGDSVVGGPFSAQVLDKVTSSGWAAIRGNNAFYLLDYQTPRALDHWNHYQMPPIVLEQLGQRLRGVLSMLPDTLNLRFHDAPSVRVFHGIPGDPFTAIYAQTSDAQVRQWLKDVTETTIICGHSHIALDRQVDDWHIINPGSVGVPLDGQFSASYMIADGNATGWHVIAHRRISFDYAPIFAEFEKQRFEEKCGIEGRLTVEEFRTARLRLYPFIQWARANHPDTPRTHALVDKFLKADIDAYMDEPYRFL